MLQDNQLAQDYQKNEKNLIKLISSFIRVIEARKKFIVILTVFFTILSILYTFNLVTTYKATSSFTIPSKNSIFSLNKLSMTSETQESVFNQFLTHLSSQSVQNKTFVEGDFINKSAIKSTSNLTYEEKESYIDRFIESIEITQNSNSKTNILNDLYYTISLDGNNPTTISDYLNSLIDKANSKTSIEINNLSNSKKSLRLEQIMIERMLLIQENKVARLNLIERIKEEDGQTIREINYKIEALRKEAEEVRLDQIVLLTSAAKLAGSLGVIGNNLGNIDNIDKKDFNFNIAINDRADLPEWYLYGEKALLQRVKLLENRSSNDPFIPELITLKNQLAEVQNNNLLKTLEARQDDSPFIPELISLEIEKKQIESTESSLSSSTKTVQLIHAARVSSFTKNKRRLVFLALIGGFILSCLLALIMNEIETYRKNPV